MVAYDRILVPTDFSEMSRCALEHALFLQAKLGSFVTLLHVVEPMRYLSSDIALRLPAGGFESIEEYASARYAQQIEDLLTSIAIELSRFEHRMTFGVPCDTIIRCALEGGYGLVVMGTHGRTGVAHLMLGSVAERVLRSASCPVLTVRAPRSDG